MDTNVVSIGLKVLKEDPEIMAGDATFCKSCKAIFNMYSKLSDPTEEEVKSQELEDEKVWVCEFCNTRNFVILMD